jgi:O-antigen/teichoic acid export membrane protein
MNTLLSVFGGGLWLIPLGILIGIVSSAYNALQQSKKTKEKFLQTGYGKWAVGLAVVLIVVLIAMYADR